MDTGCPGVLKTGRKSNPDCACAKLRGRVTAPNGVPVTKARVTKSPVMGNYHAGFGSGGGVGDRPADHSGADQAECARKRRLRGCVRCLLAEALGKTRLAGEAGAVRPLNVEYFRTLAKEAMAYELRWQMLSAQEEVGGGGRGQSTSKACICLNPFGIVSSIRRQTIMFRKYSISLGLLIVSLALTAFSSPFQAAGEQSGIPWWVWVLIILVLLGLLFWWWLRSRREEEAVPTVKAEAVAPVRVAEAAAPVAKSAPPTPDNLKRIEGIGPKISSVLRAAGITTFAQLAATDVSRLRQILTEADLAALADPSTWPEQANLAAAGKWDELEALQGELKGGRRV